MNEANQKRISVIEKLSNFEITETIDRVFQKERHLQADFILLLSEISTRRLHVQMGYSSLMVYCVEHFCLTEFSAYRRMQIARVAKRYPVLVEALRDKQLSLTTAAMIAPKLKEETSLAQIQQCKGKSKEEVKRIIVGWEPQVDVKESVRHLKAPASSPRTEQQHSESVAGANCGVSLSNFDDFFTNMPATRSTERAKEEVRPLSAERTCLRFSIDSKIEKKLERAKQLLGAQRLEEILDLALEALLEKKDPKRRQIRRQEKVARKKSDSQSKPIKAEESVPKKITTKVKDQALERAEHQCTYVSPEGKRCRERRRLELEHIRPRGKGGDNSESNVTILCKSHNLYRAVLHYGKEKVAEYVPA
ncbi:MAG: HNH endonuclease [Oligoflexales bacterium]